MRHLPIKAISVLSALGLAVGSAVAQQTAPDNQQLDPSLQELVPSTQELMDEYDQDGNQSLSEEEFTRLYGERLQASSGQGGAQPGAQGEAAPGQGQGAQGQAGQQGGAAQGGSAEIAGQVFVNLDADADMELSSEELAQVIALIDPEQGELNAAAGQQPDLNPQVGVTTDEPQVGEDRAGADNSTVFAGDIRSSTRDIGTDQEPGQDTSLTGQAGGERQAGVPAQTEADERGIAQADPQVGPNTQDQQTPQGEFGQQQGVQPGQQDQTGSQSELEQIASSQPEQLRGMAVRSPQGEDIGEVDEVVRDRDNGELFAVISSGGILGIGADKSAVPLSELQMENDAIVYGNTQEQLEQQPYEESRFEPVQAGERQAAAEEERPQEQPA